MILTYIGNEKYLSNKEIEEILQNPLVNGISKLYLAVELMDRTDWNSLKKEMSNSLKIINGGGKIA